MIRHNGIACAQVFLVLLAVACSTNSGVGTPYIPAAAPAIVPLPPADAASCNEMFKIRDPAEDRPQECRTRVPLSVAESWLARWKERLETATKDRDDVDQSLQTAQRSDGVDGGAVDLGKLRQQLREADKLVKTLTDSVNEGAAYVDFRRNEQSVNNLWRVRFTGEASGGVAADNVGQFGFAGTVGWPTNLNRELEIAIFAESLRSADLGHGVRKDAWLFGPRVRYYLGGLSGLLYLGGAVGLGAFDIANDESKLAAYALPELGLTLRFPDLRYNRQIFGAKGLGIGIQPAIPLQPSSGRAMVFFNLRLAIGFDSGRFTP